MTSASPFITLLTDFGNIDYFVPSMKGVILGINPLARIIDLSHQIPAHGIEQAAFFLHSCYTYFPEGTVHVVVVDPKVGSQRRALLASTQQYYFLAPDNGTLSYVLEQESSIEVRSIENTQYRLESNGPTFEGRDLFAPSAAWLTKGQVPDSYGPLITDYEKLSDNSPHVQDGCIHGRIVYIDHFGNAITNITAADIEHVRSRGSHEHVEIRIGGLTITGMKTHYADGATERPEALINSNGYLETFIYQGRAADHCGLQVGQQVEVLS